MASLPSTNSIVDYLNSTGQDSSFSSRRNLFNTKGLNKTMGNFQGSASQNLSLLNNLRGAGSSGAKRSPSFFEGKAPPNAFEASNFLASSPTLKPFNDALASRGSNNTANSTPARRGATQNFDLQSIIEQATGGQNGGQSRRNEANSTPNAQMIIDRIIRETGSDPSTVQSRPNQSFASDNPTSQTPAQDALGGFDLSKMSRQQKVDLLASAEADLANRRSGGQASGATQSSSNIIGMSASEVLGNFSTPSEGALVDQFLNSTEGKLEMEKLQLDNMTAQGKADATKQALETKYASEKEGLNERLAANGLAFSGIRGTQVKALADSLATSVLGVDREFATMLLNADINFRKTILDGVADLIKDASDDKSEAIKQLNAAGYAVVGDQLVPTLARQNATTDDIRADANLAISQRRLELAESANARAAASAGKGNAEKTDEFAIFYSLLSSAPEGTTNNELLAWGLQNTNLNQTEINSALGSRRGSDAALITEANNLVTDFFKKPGLSRILPGNQTSKALADAKKSAIAEVQKEGFKFNIDGRTINSREERNLLIDFINTVTTDDL